MSSFVKDAQSTWKGLNRPKKAILGMLSLYLLTKLFSKVKKGYSKMSIRKRIEKKAFRVAIIGCGFGGILAGIQLKEMGIDDFVIYEARDSVGGTWHANRYPGCGCDVTSRLFSFSFEYDWPWKRAFATQSEILNYLKSMVDKYKLNSHIVLNARVDEMRWIGDTDANKNHWAVRVTDKKSGQVILDQVNVVISAIGQLNVPKIPSFKGMDKFQGKSFHSAEWDGEWQWKGKRVGVIGTGSSGVQICPELQKSVKSLLIYQRSLSWVVPRSDYRVSSFYHWLTWLAPPIQMMKRYADFWHHETLASMIVEPLTFFGHYLRGNLKEAMTEVRQNELNRCADTERAAYLKEVTRPQGPLGCKRPVVSDDYFRMCRQENVRVIDTSEKGVAIEINEKGIGEDELDAIIFATGFETTSFLKTFKVIGPNGVEMNPSDDLQAFYGVSVHGYPNLFILYGPNTNLGHNSTIFMLETEMDLIKTMIHQLVWNDAKRVIDVKKYVQDRFNENLQGVLQKSVWASPACSNFTRNENGRIVNNWKGSCYQFWRETRQVGRHISRYFSVE